MKQLLRRIRFSVSVSTLFTLAVGLALTALTFVAVRKVESTQHTSQFQQSAELRAALVETTLQDAVQQVVVLNQLFRTFGVITREQFHNFTAPILKRYPEIQALSFQRKVLERDRHSFEVEMRRRDPDFQITEFVDGQIRNATIRDSYNVVDYIEPSVGNEAALGFDTGYTEDRTEARQRAYDTGIATSTGLLTLIQAKGTDNGFQVLAPVYWRGAPLDNVAMRLRAVIGETAAAFKVDHMIDTILRGASLEKIQGMSISAYIGDKVEQKSLAMEFNPHPVGDDPPGFGGWLLYDSVAPLDHTFSLAGNSWHLQIRQAAVPFTTNNHGSLFALLGGLLSTVLAATYVYILALRITTIEKETKERTAALQFANLRLTEDLTLRMRTEKALRLRERVIEVSANAIIICGANAPDYPIEYVNPAFVRITGYCGDEVVGRTLESLYGSSQDQQNIEEIRAALRERREGHALLRNYRKDGTDYWNDLYVAPVSDETGNISHFVVAQYDITAVMQYEAEMEYQAHHDALTGLANRNLLRERLTDAISSSDRTGTPLWVVFLDLDRFKFVNDTLGHDAGDTLLKMLSTRLQSATREADTVARLGGDEFVLVLPNQSDDAPGLPVLQSIMDMIANPLTLQEHEFFLTCSMGVAKYPGDGENAETLIKHADIAMYRSKEMGRNTFQFYTPTMIEGTLNRLSIEADLRHALERNEFVLHYQPQISLSNGRIVGMEALLRWEHPVHGSIAPSRFIGLAEEMGLIIPIGAWVIRTACAQTKAWHDAGYDELRVAVNLSARQFTQRGLAQSIADVLNTTGLDPKYLELELTESMIMNDVNNAVTILQTLKELGVKIAVDDFGTGYSSLSYLRRFPIDVLKIDQSFVNELTIDADAKAIVVAVISLAQSLRLQVIAEGVETVEQLWFLRAYGCDQFQGYYFSRPVVADSFEVLLQQGHSKSVIAYN